MVRRIYRIITIVLLYVVYAFYPSTRLGKNFGGIERVKKFTPYTIVHHTGKYIKYYTGIV